MAGAKNESLVVESDTCFRVAVREPAERNQANVRTRELLATYFGLPVGRVRIVNGHHSPSKLFAVDVEGE